MTTKLLSIAKQFAIENTIVAIVPFGSGHIHQTYRVETKPVSAPNYILQQVNHYVFKWVPELMDNIMRITTHIKQKLSAIENADPTRETLTVVPTIDGQAFWRDENGDYWRVFVALDHVISYDIVDSLAVAYEGGIAFGRYLKYLSDLPGKPLFDTIPNFHNIKSRLDSFYTVLKHDRLNLAKQVSAEIDFIDKRADEMQALYRLSSNGKIPIRNTHNDTKFNNVLFTPDNKALCVIDLDTTMQGLEHYDCGDAYRTVANIVAEDELDTSKIEFDTQKFEAFTKGYLNETKEILQPIEIEYIPFSAKLFPFTQGVRFLTDYLDGDKYYKTDYAGHNLKRTLAQFKLAQSVEQKYDKLHEIIRQIVS